MRPDRKEALAENVVAGAIVGLLCLGVAALALAAEARTEAAERSAISAETRRPVSATPFRFRERAFSRIYAIEGKGPRLYGAVLALDSIAGSADFVAVMDAKGGLYSARTISATSPRLPFAAEGWLAAAAGGRSAAGALSARPDPLEALCRTRAEEAIDRLSAAVEALGGKAR